MLFDYGCSCDKRKYHTKWTWNECRSFLQRKNIYDTFEYKLVEEDESLIIVFIRPLKRMGGFMNGRYSITPLQSNDGTIFTVEYINEWFSFTYMSDVLLDEFFSQKLDATPIK